MSNDVLTAVDKFQDLIPSDIKWKGYFRANELSFISSMVRKSSHSRFKLSPKQGAWLLKLSERLKYVKKEEASTDPQMVHWATGKGSLSTSYSLDGMSITGAG